MASTANIVDSEGVFSTIVIISLCRIDNGELLPNSVFRQRLSQAKRHSCLNCVAWTSFHAPEYVSRYWDGNMSVSLSGHMLAHPRHSYTYLSYYEGNVNSTRGEKETSASIETAIRWWSTAHWIAVQTQRDFLTHPIVSVILWVSYAIFLAWTQVLVIDHRLRILV